LQAIYASTLAELADSGFGRLTMEGIAGRAKTGKMPLYRRWSCTQDLVLDALRNALANLTGLDSELPDTADLRADLLALLGQVRAVMAGPVGPAMIALLSERTRHPELLEAVREHFGVHGRILRVLRAAAEHGEIRADRVNPRIAYAGPALMIVQFITTGLPPGEDEVASIVDDVLLPALGRT
jgi:AcrR family transcriptional regulator